MTDAHGPDQVAGLIAQLAEERERRRRAEAALAENRRILETFLGALPETALLMGPAGTVLMANPTARQRLGIDPDHPERNNYFAALPAEIALDRKLLADEALRTGRPVRFEDRNGDRALAVYFHPAPADPDLGPLVALLAIDITERRRLEAQLSQVQKLEAIGTLSAGVAHEFNNILTAIVGQASVLEMKLGSGHPLLQHVQQILVAATRVERLTRALLTFSRQQTSEPVAIDLNFLVRQTGLLAEPMLGEKVEWRQELAERELVVRVDPGQIEQVLLNLAINARDAMPDGGRITVATRYAVLDDAFFQEHGETGMAGRYAHLSMTDTGVGMDKTTLSRIFEPFFTTKEVGRGTGLGLSTALGIIRQHQGFVNCRSETGRGTIFNLFFPLIA